MNNRKKLLIVIFGGIGLLVLFLSGMIVYCGSVGATIAYINGESVYIYPKRLDLGNQKPGTETVVVFYMKNLTSKNISIVGENSSCTCTFSEKIPITAQARKTVELQIKMYFPKYECDYDQMILFIVAEPKRLTMHPVHVIAKILVSLKNQSPVESKEINDNPQTEDNHIVSVLCQMF